MTRYDQYGALDDQPKPLGDTRFMGVNMRLDPALVPPGYVSEAINMRFRNGIAETRKGFTVLPWLNKQVTATVAISSLTQGGGTVTAVCAAPAALTVGSVVSVSGADQVEYNGAQIVTSYVPSTNTFTYTIAGNPASPATGSPVVKRTTVQPWGQVHGVGVFSDPFTLQEYLIIAADGGVYYTQPGNGAQTMTLPVGVTITGNVEFSQAFDVLLMHRGASETTLMLPRITLPWQLVEQTSSGNGTEAIPNATHSLFLQNRLFIPNDNDEIAVSDLNDYTRYVPVLQEFKINQGSADELVAIYKFNDTTIIAFKEHSVYALSNVYGNLSALQQDELVNQFGLVARKSVAHVGNDLWFLSELGVMSIAQTEQNKLQGVLVPVSDPIQPLIDRINWRYASAAVAAYADSKYYLAVPLDDAEVLGFERSPIGLAPPNATYTIQTTAGRRYRWINGGDQWLDNGTQRLLASADFIAQGATVSVRVGAAVVAGSLKEVTGGVNNAVLVYDFLNGAWCGYDQAEGFAFRDFKQFTYNGRQQLFCVTQSGHLTLYEDDFEDQLPVPYAELSLLATDVDEFIQVNGGALITMNGGFDFNGASTLGIGGLLAISRNNVFADGDQTDGYYAGCTTTVWSAPGTLAAKTSTGARFYGTNGAVPVIAVLDTSLSWTITEVNTQPIIATLTTRGYASDVLALDDFDWLAVDLQTWAPSTSIDLFTTGVNEEQAILTDQTRDRTAYYEPGDAAAFDLDNDNGDFLTPYRQDYSLLLGTGAGAAADFAFHTVTDGVPLGLHQEARITERSNASGRAAQVRLTNEQGRMRVMAVALETNEDNFSAGTKA